MKTEDIDKRIGMPDVDAEWAKFEREVIGQEAKSHKSIMLWGLSIAATVALVAGIFLLWNNNNEQTDEMLAKDTSKQEQTRQDAQVGAPLNQKLSEEQSEAGASSSQEKEMVNGPDADLLAVTTPSNKLPNEATSNETVYDVLEEDPIYPGGEKALREFIKTNQRYPDLAMEYGARGRVIMTFLIDSVGQVTNIKVVRNIKMSYDTLRLSRETEDMQQQVKQQIANLLGEESKRILSLMPRWTPGKMHGKHVNVKYAMPIQFQATEAEREEFLTLRQKNILR